MRGNNFPRLKPYYKGFNGVFKEQEGGYICEGNCYIKESADPILVIDELPI